MRRVSQIRREPVVPVGTAHMMERHYSVREIAEAWGVSDDVIRDLFRSEPGVVDLGAGLGGRGGRKYQHLRIPQAVVERVYRQRQRA